MTHHRCVRIRLPLAGLIIPVMVAFCVLPLATIGGAWALFYALPVSIAVVMLAGGTTARPTGLSAWWLYGRRHIPWESLEQLEFPGQRWAVAVTTSGERILLPGVRPADLPRIVDIAGGNLYLYRPTADVPTEATDTDQAAIVRS